MDFLLCLVFKCFKEGAVVMGNFQEAISIIIPGNFTDYISDDVNNINNIRNLHQKVSVSSLFMTKWFTGLERIIRSHSSARFCFELSGNSNKQCILNMKC